MLQNFEILSGLLMKTCAIICLKNVKTPLRYSVCLLFVVFVRKGASMFKAVLWQGRELAPGSSAMKGCLLQLNSEKRFSNSVLFVCVEHTPSQPARQRETGACLSSALLGVCLTQISISLLHAGPFIDSAPFSMRVKLHVLPPVNPFTRRLHLV